MSTGGKNGALPKGWAAARLGRIADCRLGKMLDQAKNRGEPRPYLRNINVQWGRIDLHDVKQMRIEADETEQYAVMPGDLLVCEGGEPGRCAVWNDSREMYLQKALHRVRPRDGVLPEYLRWWIQDRAVTGQLAALFTGSTIKHLPGRQLAQLDVSVPPLAEQRRIAAQLEDIEARRAATAARLSAARAAVERFRSAVLAAAYAEAERIATSVPLEHLLREPLKNGYSARPTNRETPVRVLSLTATTSGRFDSRHFKYTDEVIPSDSPLWLEPGDILIQRGNTAEFVGVPAMYDGLPGEFIYPDLMIRARVRNDIQPRYAWYMLLAPQARAFLRDRATGTAGNMPKVNQKTVNAVPIPSPRSDIQVQLVARLDRSFDVADATLIQVDEAEDRLERAGRAALAKAFRGELVPTEAALAAEEGRAFESADELLARADAREPQPSSPRPRGRS